MSWNWSGTELRLNWVWTGTEVKLNRVCIRVELKGCSIQLNGVETCPAMAPIVVTTVAVTDREVRIALHGEGLSGDGKTNILVLVRQAWLLSAHANPTAKQCKVSTASACYAMPGDQEHCEVLPLLDVVVMGSKMP